MSCACLCGQTVNDEAHQYMMTQLDAIMATERVSGRLDEEARALVRVLAMIIEDYELIRWPIGNLDPEYLEKRSAWRKLMQGGASQ
jgi:hypothetical protein